MMKYLIGFLVALALAIIFMILGLSEFLSGWFCSMACVAAVDLYPIYFKKDGNNAGS